MTTNSGTLGAILLAGGRATRVGGAAKPLFEVGGRTLLTRTVDAVTAAGSTRLVIAGPSMPVGMEDHAPIEWAQEDPPFGGPAAGIVAALRVWDEDPEWMLVLACDLPRVDAAVPRLIAGIGLRPSHIDGVCLADASSRPQWLTGLYRTAALRRGADALPAEGRDASVRALLGDLAIAVSTVSEHIAADIDTWEDLRDARRRLDGPRDHPKEPT